MSSWIQESQLVRELANSLLSPKRIHYQEDYISMESSHLRI